MLNDLTIRINQADKVPQRLAKYYKLLASARPCSCSSFSII